MEPVTENLLVVLCYHKLCRNPVTRICVGWLTDGTVNERRNI